MPAIKFNINEYVRVKLTEHGRELHRKDHQTFWKDHKNAPPYYAPNEDADGWSKWQMWSLMEAFGKYTGLCKKPCFETTIEILTD